jgi:hypothetical protein
LKHQVQWRVNIFLCTSSRYEWQSNNIGKKAKNLELFMLQ